jgi:hypothetical protein
MPPKADPKAKDKAAQEAEEEALKVSNDANLVILYENKLTFKCDSLSTMRRGRCMMLCR